VWLVPVPVYLQRLQAYVYFDYHVSDDAAAMMCCTADTKWLVPVRLLQYRWCLCLYLRSVCRRTCVMTPI
jgi:hypothetical protein